MNQTSETFQLNALCPINQWYKENNLNPEIKSTGGDCVLYIIRIYMKSVVWGEDRQQRTIGCDQYSGNFDNGFIMHDERSRDEVNGDNW